ncbi:hypothetical protein B0H14DRAFT_2605417 [Mycena olivaceomarginata]|nr:hypothetical protein B0H14DRAFT_2605417 [Mycena olivaceomarginata]
MPSSFAYTYYTTLLDKGAQPGQRRLRERRRLHAEQNPSIFGAIRELAEHNEERDGEGLTVLFWVRVQVGGTQPDGWLGLNLHRASIASTLKRMEPYLKRGLREKGLDIIPLNIGNKTHEVLGVATAVMSSLHGGEREKERKRERDSLTPTAHDEQYMLEEGYWGGQQVEPIFRVLNHRLPAWYCANARMETAHSITEKTE